MAHSSNQVKVVLLGDSGVGKSSIVLRFITDSFKPESEPTIGASFLSKTIQVEDKSVSFQIWDTAGQERYQSLAKMYYKDAHAAILVYDITQESSWTGLVNWHQQLKENGPENMAIAVAGNKDDLAERETVDIGIVKEYVKENDFVFTKTSAKEDIGIKAMFESIAKKLHPEWNKKRRETHTVKKQETNSETKKKKKCC